MTFFRILEKKENLKYYPQYKEYCLWKFFYSAPQGEIVKFDDIHLAVKYLDEYMNNDYTIVWENQ
jgi:hypothetical protein